MKKKNIYLPLVVTGYILFSLLVVGTLVSTTIPYVVLLFSPDVLHVNVAVILVGFTVGTLLPALLGYSIGSHAVKTKRVLTRHFHGILFGLLAYWIMIFLSAAIIIPPEFSKMNWSASIAVMSLLPSLGVALIAMILSISHMRSRHAKQDILHYRPFSVLLVIVIILLPVWSLAQNTVTGSVNLYSFVPMAIVAVLGLISYATLRKVKIKKYEKVIWAAISISVLFIALFVLPQLVSSIFNLIFPKPTMEMQIAANLAGYILALAGWFAYWAEQVKSLRSNTPVVVKL